VLFDDALYAEIFQLMAGFRGDRGCIHNDRAGITGQPASFDQAEPIDAGHAKVRHESFESLWIFPDFLESVEAVIRRRHDKPSRGEGRLQRGEKEMFIIDAKDRRA
jgi:hypothetical protein